MAKDIKLNKIVAVEKAVKSSTYKKFTKVHQQLQKSGLLSGISRTYRPKDDGDDLLPAEQTRVQLRAQDALDDAVEVLTRLFDVVATKDWGNTRAVADVVVKGEVLVEKAPVTYLLFLEKQLSDLHTFIEKLPVLDGSEIWQWDANQACYATSPMETHRTKKVPRVLVKYEATEEHPAQTEVWHEDVVVGYWRTVKFSGALPAQRVKRLLQRVELLQDAVKHAREEANSLNVQDVNVGAKVLHWLFAPEQG